MSRIWTSVSLEGNKTHPIKHTLHAGFDYDQAERRFREEYPQEHLVVLMPGKIELRTYNTKEKNHA
tara:strand:+ start:6167 stop:6364 length:198 start_codon:yes stop_codon:yes gene_type:complete